MSCNYIFYKIKCLHHKWYASKMIHKIILFLISNYGWSIWLFKMVKWSFSLFRCMHTKCVCLLCACVYLSNISKWQRLCMQLVYDDLWTNCHICCHKNVCVWNLIWKCCTLGSSSKVKNIHLNVGISWKRMIVGWYNVFCSLLFVVE